MSLVKRWRQAVEDANRRKRDELQDIKSERETLINNAIHANDEEIDLDSDSDSEEDGEYGEAPDPGEGREWKLWGTLRF